MNNFNALAHRASVECTRLYNDLPHDTYKTALRSGLGSAAVWTLLSGSVFLGLGMGAIAATASVVFALSKSVFRDFADARGNLDWKDHVLRVFSSTLIAALPLALFDSVHATFFVAEATFYAFMGRAFNRYESMPLNESRYFCAPFGYNISVQA